MIYNTKTKSEIDIRVHFLFANLHEKSSENILEAFNEE